MGLSPSRPFLTAEWRHLVILNYEVPPSSLLDLVPSGTELDSFEGRAFLSLVGFLFEKTRVLGVPVPLHRRFEEVNLRFYVRRAGREGDRRGVVFVKEIVPRRAVAFLARALYGENYVALPMSHRIEPEREGPRSVAYCWSFEGRTESLSLAGISAPRSLAPGSEEEFIAEHYFGYTRLSATRSVEYAVEHPPWRVASALDAVVDCNVSRLYGGRFAAWIRGRPHSAFWAEGSPVRVFPGVSL
jgi:uncharacterized protein YqjF (DUF2071 family)